MVFRPVALFAACVLACALTAPMPWVMINGFQVKIDGCVGESFIRSYAFLTRSTDVSDAILAYCGVTKKV